MGLSEQSQRAVFGVHSITPYNRSTGMPDWGIFKVIGDMSIDLSTDFVRLNGGSNSYPWAVEKGIITAEASGTIRSYQDDAINLFLAGSVTANSAEATGNVSSLTNKYGTSVQHATTGIDSIAATGSDEADLKFGKYVFQASASDKVKLYCLSDVDFLRGTDAEFQDDDLLAVAEITLTGSSATQAIADYGLTITEGSGSPSLTIGDTATFEVRPITSTGSSIIDVGASGSTSPEFGCLFVAEKRGSGQLFEINAYRCFAFGYPIGLTEKEWAEAAITINLIYDSSEDKVFSIRAIDG